MTNVQFANDEGDPGMGLELGLNGFLFGGRPLHSTVRHLMTTAYNLVRILKNNFSISVFDYQFGK